MISLRGLIYGLPYRPLSVLLIFRIDKFIQEIVIAQKEGYHQVLENFKKLSIYLVPGTKLIIPIFPLTIKVIMLLCNK